MCLKNFEESIKILLLLALNNVAVNKKSLNLNNYFWGIVVGD